MISAVYPVSQMNAPDGTESLSFVDAAEIPEDIRNRWGAGQLATVHVDVSRETVAQRIASNITDWIDSKRSIKN